MGKLLRTFLAIATFFVAWLVVSPARAWTNLAPICDPRGATTFAPPPQIQDPEQSLDIPADCGDSAPVDTTNLVRGRAPQIDITFSQEPVARAEIRVPAHAFVERLRRPRASLDTPPSGVRMTIDRPPRG
jgi:hypothetical protein